MATARYIDRTTDVADAGGVRCWCTPARLMDTVVGGKKKKMDPSDADHPVK